MPRDQKRPVKFSQVEKAVTAFVTNPPRYHLLLVYFSGHGYWHARADVWLLSDAPVRADEAINLTAAIDLAKHSGIPNVIFVSDACRSIPNTRGGVRVEGRGLFPNYDDIAEASTIDWFKATSEALPAYEGNINGKSQSLLTAALMLAYEEPKPTMVLKVVQGRGDHQGRPQSKTRGLSAGEGRCALGNHRSQPIATHRSERAFGRQCLLVAGAPAIAWRGCFLVRSVDRPCRLRRPLPLIRAAKRPHLSLSPSRHRQRRL